MATPTNIQSGGQYILQIGQDVTGGRVPSFSSAYKWPNNVTPTHNTTAGTVSIYSFVGGGGGQLYGSLPAGPYTP
jgi:hypothetical protein